MKIKYKFYVCRDCGQTRGGKRYPKTCHICKSSDLGEIQIKWREK